jgi:type I restriction enzyme S subunit
MSSSLLALSGQDDPKSLVPDGWVAKQLGATCDIFGGGRLGLTKEKDYQSTGVLAFSAAGPDGFVDVAEIKDKDGVILSAIGANCGRCFYASGDWTTLANVQAIIPKDEVHAKYLFYYVNRDRYWDRSGSAQPFIKPSSIRSSWVVYPKKKAEQAKIAEVLSTLDRAIEQTEALIAKQQRIKTGLMQDLLTKGIDEHGNIRSEATHAFKDSPLGRIPVEWEVRQLGEVARQITSGSRGWARYYSSEGAIFLRIGNLTREHINLRLDDLVFVQVPESSEGKRTAVLEGDLLISITADLGIIGVIPKDFGEAYVNQHIALVRLDCDAVNPRFVGHLLNGIVGLSQIEKLNESGAKAGLNLPTVAKLLVFVPKMAEQERVSDLLDAADEQIERDKANLRKLTHQKSGLMHDLLTGERRVTPLLAPAATQ